MRHRFFLFKLLTITLLLIKSSVIFAQPVFRDSVISEKLLYHAIHLDPQDNKILPWYSNNLGNSYDFIINKVWNFWDTMRIDKNGLPYYMNHQVWRSDFNDKRGVGGDQFAMALSSWNLYYGYSGNEAVKEEMKFIADYYIAHSSSTAHSVWPNIPYPYNSMIYAGVYDGDMVLGKGFTQPDKAGSFGFELVKLYKMNNSFPWPNITDQQYLNAAIGIANTLAKKVKQGDAKYSPLPFKVNANTGEIGKLKSNTGSGKIDQLSNYTTNWAGTMELFLNLIELKKGDTESYKKAFNILLIWMKKYPLKTNKWGPFFEDIPGWSDTQINAISFAQFMMNHPNYFPDWKAEVKEIFNWVYHKLGNRDWIKYGVTVVNEQTAYQTPGNSHTLRQAAAELQYAMMSGDSSIKENAVRQLNWATYMVDHDGKNCYPKDEVWMTDGYGDYIRHFLNAMAAYPILAPSNQNHLLSTTSVIQLMAYSPIINKFLVPEVPLDQVKQTLLSYRTFDKRSTEIFRLIKKPMAVFVNAKKIEENDKAETENWSWKPMSEGGILTIRHSNGNQVFITDK
jgi:hypothetical protein